MNEQIKDKTKPDCVGLLSVSPFPVHSSP